MAADCTIESLIESKIDIKIDSPRKLYRQLHDILEESGYKHEYKPLRIEKDAISDIAIFESELIGKKDSQGCDKFKLILAIICALTILLIPVSAILLKSSLYPLRTIAKIQVEGEAYRTKVNSTNPTTVEQLDIISDARVILTVNAGIAGKDDEITKPTKVKREKRMLKEESYSLQDRLLYVLLKAALLPSKSYI